MNIFKSLDRGIGELARLLGLNGHGGRVRQVILRNEETGEGLTLPVTPYTYEITSGQQNKIVNIVDFGEALIFGTPKLRTLALKSFFPSARNDYPFIVGDIMDAPECVDLITKWKEEKKPIRVIISDSNINFMFAINSFNYTERDGTRDIYYSLELTEYKDLNTPTANNDKQVDSTTGLKDRPVAKKLPDKAEITPNRHTDIMDVAKKTYGDYKHWRNIVAHNKLDVLNIPNRATLKVPKNTK